MMRAQTLLAALSLAAVCGVLSGCTLSNTAAPTGSSVFLSGSVYGGSLPVAQAHIYLFAANTQGLAGPGIPPGPGILNAATNTSISLLKAAANTASDTSGNYYVTSGTNGSFTLTGDYATCTPGQQLYLYASGGNAGAGNNTATGMMAVLGGCTATYPNANTHVKLNEMSTVAAAYALAGYASDATHIADDEAVSGNKTAAQAQVGMANAFANAANLVTLATGVPLYTTPGTNGTIPTTTVNTIASLLADCIQSIGPTTPPCVDLFTYTGTPSGGDTATAAIRLSQNPAGVPGSTVTTTTMFNSLPQNVAYTPVLTSAPNDFSLPIVFGGPGINGPSGVAVDAAGNVWMPNSVGNSVSEFVAAGAAYTETPITDSSLSVPSAVAVDLNGSIWLSNNGNGSVTEFTPSSGTYKAASYTGGGLSVPEEIAVDGKNNVWVADLASSALVEFAGSGTSYVATAYTGVNVPYAVAVDAGENIWAGDYVDGTATEFTPGAGTYTPTLYPGTMSNGYSDAVDAAGSIWYASNGDSSLGKFSGSGSTYTSAIYTGGGLKSPVSVAVDGGGSVWLANASGKSISKFSNAGSALSPATNGITGTSSVPGATGGPLAGPSGIAVDGSGNVWVSDSSNTVVEFMGAGSPTVVPLATAVSVNKLGVQP